MKTLSFLKSHFLVAAALLTAGVTMSFKMADSKAVNTVYYYNSSDTTPGAFADDSNWTTTESFSCITLSDKPCKMTVPPGTTLNDQIGGKTNAQVLAIHPSERRGSPSR